MKFEKCLSIKEIIVLGGRTLSERPERLFQKALNGDFAAYQTFGTIEKVVPKGLDSVKLDELRRCAILKGMRFVGNRRFCRVSDFWDDR